MRGSYQNDQPQYGIAQKLNRYNGEHLQKPIVLFEKSELIFRRRIKFICGLYQLFCQHFDQSMQRKGRFS